MLNLLNAVDVFGRTHESWSPSTAKGLLITVLVLVYIGLALMVWYLVRLIRRNRAVLQEVMTPPVRQQPEQKEVVVIHEEQPEVERILTGISLDTAVVKREFAAGEEFDCSGLVICGEFNMAPTTESYTEYRVVDNDTYEWLNKLHKTEGVYVIKPQMDTVGVKVVTVKFENVSAAYTVSVEESKVEETAAATSEVVVVERPVVVEKVVERIVERVVEKEPATVEQQHPTVNVVDPVIIEEESVVAGNLRYNKSFEARLIQADDQTKNWYSDIKNELLSYKKVNDRMSWKRESFRLHKEAVARLAFRGKILCLFLPLSVAEYAEKYHVEDASDAVSYADTPMMLRLKNPRRVKVAKMLIAEVMKKVKAVRIDRDAVDYYVPYEGVVELIKKGLIRRVVRTSEQEAIFTQGAVDTTNGEEDENFGLEKVAKGIYVTKND